LRRKAKKPDREGEECEDEDGEEEDDDDDENEKRDDEDEEDEDEEVKSRCSMFTTPSWRHSTLVLQTGQVSLRCNHGWMQARWKMCYEAII
jgi:hypothetical protein